MTTGQGNYFYQPYPFVLETKLQSIFSHVGVPLQVRDVAIGGCPAFPYRWCISSFWGTNTNVISWDFAMNDAGGDLLGMEALHSPCLATSEMTQTHCQGHLHGNLET